MICFVFSRVDGVLRGPRSVLLSLLGLVDGAPAQGWGGGTCASLGAGRVATIRALLCAYVRR